MGLISRGNTLPVSVRLGFPTNQNGSDRRAFLEITDETSSLLMLELEISAEQLMALLGGSTAYVTAGITSRLDRLGKQMQHGSTTWDDGHETKEPEAQARAEAWAAENGWESVSVRQAHGTWRAIGRRWAAAE